MSISNRGSGRTLRMIPGAVGHNYSEDHQSAPRARRSRPLISQVASGAKRSVSGGRFVKHAAACRRMNLPAEPTGLAWPASHPPVVARQSEQGGTMLQLPAHKRYAYSPIVKRPDYAWPGGKRLAFYIALNIEHFAFGTGIGMDPSQSQRAAELAKFRLARLRQSGRQLAPVRDPRRAEAARVGASEQQRLPSLP